MILADEVKEHLIKLGIETPVVVTPYSNEVKKSYIRGCVTEIMTILGLDLNDDSLIGTPERVARMYVDEVFSGLDYGNFPKITTICNKMKLDSMVVVSDINLSSTCEHHFVTIDGLAKIAYVPKDKILGLSKINRVVAFFAKRPQVQERLTQQIIECLKFILDTDDVAVQIKATHFCVKARGIQDVNSYTSTCSLSGIFFDDPTVRGEFLNG